jgi:hypothetical protein
LSAFDLLRVAATETHQLAHDKTVTDLTDLAKMLEATPLPTPRLLLLLPSQLLPPLLRPKPPLPSKQCYALVKHR